MWNVRPRVHIFSGGQTTMEILELAKQYHALERVDGIGDTFRRRARILQSMWRTEQGYELGEHRGRPLGSRLQKDWAEETLANFLTPTIRQVVREDVLESAERGRLIKRDRLLGDLLSSQPLCFNLFGELQRDLDACTAVMSEMTRGRVRRVTRVAFEHSPGRGDASYTGDRSAFDVYLEYQGGGGVRGFVGIEVKYHEDLKGVAADHRGRYDVVAEEMGCFRGDARDRLLRQPLQQIWRDHLLAGSILARGEFDEGCFVFLHPRGNYHCAEAVAGYAACLTAGETFAAWTLEGLVATIRRHVAAPWVDAAWDRYLDFGKIDRALAAAATPAAPPPDPTRRNATAVDGPDPRRTSMASNTLAKFEADAQGRRFMGVVRANPGLFDQIVGFLDDPGRQRRMLDAVDEDHPALAGVVIELEQQAWFDEHMRTTSDTRRLRQAIGVLVKVIVQGHGLRTTGRKGSLRESRWFGGAEKYLPHDVPS